MHYFQRVKTTNKVSSENPQTLENDRENYLLNEFNLIFKNINILYARHGWQLQPDNGGAY
jgi:hypothetical protein